MMHQLNCCKFCKGEAIYIHIPADKIKPAQLPAEHKIVCKSCDFETQTHRYSVGAMKEWNDKKSKTNR